MIAFGEIRETWRFLPPKLRRRITQIIIAGALVGVVVIGTAMAVIVVAVHACMQPPGAAWCGRP